MRDGLREIERTKREAWRLGPLTDDLPAHFINGRELWAGKSYMDGRREVGTGPGKVAFRAWSERVESQPVTLGFRELPDPRRVAEIIDTLNALVDRSVA
jgi:hypothetical protein